MATLLSGCAGGVDPGMLLVVHDKYSPYTCDEIARERATHAARERHLSGLSQKAEAAPAGAVVSAVAYSTELATVRSELRAADRAMAAKDCPPPSAVPAAVPAPPPPPPPPKKKR